MKESLKPIQRFWRMLQADRPDISRVFAYAIFNGLVNLSIPLGIQAIVNLIQGGQVSTSWIILVIVVVAGVSLTGVIQLLQLRIIETLQQKLFVRAAFEFAYRIPRIRSEALEKHDASELMNRFFDTVSVQKGLSKILIDFSTATLQVLFGLILLSFYHPFFILFSVILVFLVYAIFLLTSKRGMETSLVESKFKYKVAYWLENLALSKDSFKLAGRTNLHLDKTDENTSGYLKARESHFGVLRKQYIMLIVFKAIVAAGLLLIGGLLVLNQLMNIGQFIAAEIIILLVIGSVEKLILSLENIYDVLAALEKIGYVTDLELESAEGSPMHTPHGEPVSVEVNRLEFTYPGGDRPVIQGFSMHAKAGEKVCITGSNGSGKSTLIQLLSGLYKAQSGSISFNGLPIDNYMPDELRSQVGIRLDGEKLFHGTLEENITLGRTGITPENILWSVVNMHLSELVKSLPQGLRTMIGHDGVKLPKSAVQKILLARSIVTRPGLLLIENSLAFIEENERKSIIAFLTDQSNRWTLIASSMDATFMSHCTRVITMQPVES